MNESNLTWSNIVPRGLVFSSLETVVCACANHAAAMMMMQEHNNKDANPNLAILIWYVPFVPRNVKICINVQEIVPFVFQQREENQKTRMNTGVPRSIL